MRVDRKIWGPGPWPGSRVVVAYPGDDLDEAVLAELEADEPGNEPEPEPVADPAPESEEKPRRRRSTKRKAT